MLWKRKTVRKKIDDIINNPVSKEKYMDFCVHKIKIDKNVIKEEWGVSLKKYEIDFLPGVNILIGNNGSGKTTLLNVLEELKRKNHDPKPSITKIEEQDEIKYIFKNEMYEIHFNYGRFLQIMVDKENRNIWNDDSDLRGIEVVMENTILKTFSHGERVKRFLLALNNHETCIIDEPESALDIKGIETLLKKIQNSRARQIIIATHSPFLILGNNFNIIEMEKGYRKKVEEIYVKLYEKIRGG